MTGPVRDEPVVWQWPVGPWQRLRAGSWVWNQVLTPLVTAAVIFMFAAGVLVVAAEETGSENTPWLLALTFVFALGPPTILLGFGCLFASRLTLTQGQLRLSSRIPWRREKAVTRSDVHSLVIHEGDGTVVLQGREGELLRARHVGEWTVLEAALGVPTIAWPVRNKSKAVRWLLAAELFILIPLAISILFLVSFVTFGLYELVAGPGHNHGINSFIFFPILLGSPVLSQPLAMTVVLAVGRLFASPEALDDFIRINRDNCRWHGYVPSRWNLLLWFFPVCARLATRVAGIAPPPPLQPKLRHGATPEMAAEAMAMAEGSA